MKEKTIKYLKALVLGVVVSLSLILLTLSLSMTFEVNGFAIMSGAISAPLLGGFLAGYVLKEKVWRSLRIGISIGLLSSIAFLIYRGFLPLLVFLLPLMVVLGAISAVGGGKVRQGVSRKDFNAYSKSLIVALIISVPLGYPLGLLAITMLDWVLWIAPMIAGILAGVTLNRGVWKGVGVGFFASGLNIVATITLVKIFEAPGPASTTINIIGGFSPLFLLSGVIGGALGGYIARKVR